MDKIIFQQMRLIGLSLKTKTSNANGQSAIDCGNLWAEFEKGSYDKLIPGKLTNEVLAVYHHYEGDHTQPFSYFIGCKVKDTEEVPSGLQSLVVPEGNYQKIVAKGKMPDCLINAWKNIWSTNIPRSYQIDFEVYGAKSKDWSDAEVEIYLSIGG